MIWRERGIGLPGGHALAWAEKSTLHHFTTSPAASQTAQSHAALPSDQPPHSRTAAQPAPAVSAISTTSIPIASHRQISQPGQPRRCEALLSDYCGQYKRERFVLIAALKNRVAADLLKTSAGVPQILLTYHSSTIYHLTPFALRNRA